MKKILFAVVLTLAGCQTPYTEIGAMGGVTAVQMSADIYRISARGNGFTDNNRVIDFIFVKAAETAIAAGKTHFVIGPYRDATSHSVVQSPTIVVPVGRFVSAFGGGVDVVKKPGLDVLIRVLNAKPGETGVVDARGALERIGPRVRG